MGTDQKELEKVAFHAMLDTVWSQEIEKYAVERDGPLACKFLVGNKCDVPLGKRAVSFEEGKNLADDLGVKFFETSAKNAHNVEQAFDSLCQEIMAKVAPSREPKQTDTIDLRNIVGTSSRCPC